MLRRIASFSFRRRWLVLATWLVAAVAVTALAGTAGGDYADGGRLPGTDSDKAYQLAGAEFPSSGGDTATIVFRDPNGLNDDRAAIDGYLATVRSLAGVAAVTSPFEAGGQLAPSGTVAYATVDFARAGPTAEQDAADAMRAAARSLDGTSVQTSFGGFWFTDGGVPSSELFGLLAAGVILLVAFGSLVAMGLPLLTAIIGIVVALAGVQLWAAVLDTPDFTVQVASMIGIGVGIDYALFIVTRYRQELAHRSPHDAAVEAIATAGRAVVLAGGTVMISLLGMLLMGLSFFHGLALGSSSAVLVAIIAAVTLLPALLGLVGHRIDRLSIHRRRSARTATPAAARETVWHRWARFVQRRPVVATVAGVASLLAMAAPVLGMRLASADAGNDPAGSTTRLAYDRLAEGFGPGFNGPLLVVLRTPTDAARAALPAVTDALAAAPGVAAVMPAQPSASGNAALVTLVPTTSPQSTATEDLVRHLRHDVLPAFANAGLEAHVGGATASNIDFAAIMSDRLPIFVGAVLLCSFLLLLAVFRSVLVPLKAVIMNLLSIGAAYGAMVAVFQWGWFGSLFGVQPGTPIEPWAPMMLFAIVFGLSMDYEVFLLSSVKERYDATGDNSHAVVEGLASTARVITAAAAIMVCVFGSFLVAELRGIRLIGFGLAAAVLIDATIVRLVVVPATMELLGRRNWWMPRWLDRVVPQVRVEDNAPPASFRDRQPVDVG